MERVSGKIALSPRHKDRPRRSSWRGGFVCHMSGLNSLYQLDFTSPHLVV